VTQVFDWFNKGGKLPFPMSTTPPSEPIPFHLEHRAPRQFVIEDPSDRAIRAAIVQANGKEVLKTEELDARVDSVRGIVQLLVTIERNGFEALMKEKKNKLDEVHAYFRKLCQEGALSSENRMELSASKLEDEDEE